MTCSRILIVILSCASLAPAQGSITSFGSGCGVLGGPVLTMTGTPEPGGAFTITASNLHLVSAVSLVVGFSNTSSPYGPLPLALPAPPFDPGCTLYTSGEIIVPLPLAGASATLTGSFPPGFDDYHLYSQVLVIGPTFWQISNALDVHVLAPAPGFGDVGGLVTDGNGSAETGTRMTLFDPSLSFFEEVRTDGSGAYTFQNVPTGSYSLGAAQPGRDYQEVPVVVTANGQLQVNFTTSPETHPGAWSVIGTTAPEFLDATDIAVLRPDGTIFYCHDTTDPIVFDPVAGTNSYPPASGSPQGCMNATLLGDGSVLLFGGQNGSSPASFTNAISWVKRFKTDDTWQVMGDMLAPTGRWYPGLARLADGRPLVFGGGTAPAAVRTDTAEIFDPLTQTWSWADTMGSPNEFAPAALLTNGLVLRSWGAAPEVYDPTLDAWSPTGAFVSPARGYPGHSDHSLLVLTSGQALAIGVSRIAQPTAPMTEFYDPSSGAWTAGSSSDLVRMQGEVVYMPDGKVFYGAGDQETTAGPEPNVLGIVRRCDLFEPAQQTWRRVADMSEYREYHAVTLLIPDGRIVTTGGTQIKFAYGPTSADIEAYSPPYLFRGVRPSIDNLSDATPARGQTVSVDVFPATAITKFVLMGLQSHTHWVDGGIPRRLELAPTQSGGTAQLTIPTDANLVPAGWYMLFAMVDDIPSEALILRVD